MEADGEIEELPPRIDIHHPRDLLRRFSAGDGARRVESAEVAGGDTVEVELSLDLSLGGCFGAEPGDKRLVRSSSIAMFPFDREDFPKATRDPFARSCSLPAETKTCSLPSLEAETETDEERRKRKEMQSLNRLEAKRKRSEKRAAAAIDRREQSLDDDDNKGDVAGGKFVGKENGAVVDAELARWMVPAAGGRPTPQGSVGSQGSNSSVVSDLESKPAQAASPNQVTGKPANLPREGDEPSKKNVKVCTTNRASGAEEMERSMMEEMPCVSTKGDGPNGRRIEGFLYKYREGVEVRIVCVCHGRFLTPAEFVKHAGGGDVAHPLRHIVVNTTPSAFL